MVISKKTSVVLLILQFIVILLLSGVCLFQWKAIRKQEQFRQLPITQTDNNHKALKLAYFDDITAGWGDGKPDGSIEWKAGDSKYAARTTPISIIHPLELKATQEKLVAIPRSEVLAEIDSLGLNNYLTLIDETARKYGEVRSGYFTKMGQYILDQRYFDVDKDGVKEEVIETMAIGGNHPPHEGFILKNDTIILSLPLNSGGIDPATDGNGFYVKHQVYDDQPMCCPLKYRLYRVIYEDGKFVPVWEQDVSYLRFTP